MAEGLDARVAPVRASPGGAKPTLATRPRVNVDSATHSRHNSTLEDRPGSTVGLACTGGAGARWAPATPGPRRGTHHSTTPAEVNGDSVGQGAANVPLGGGAAPSGEFLALTPTVTNRGAPRHACLVLPQ
jgi:hypothetical protein